MHSGLLYLRRSNEKCTIFLKIFFASSASKLVNNFIQNSVGQVYRQMCGQKLCFYGESSNRTFTRRLIAVKLKFDRIANDIQYIPYLNVLDIILIYFCCIAGVALCVLCLMSAIGFSLLDNYGNKKLGLKEDKVTSSVKA